MLLAPLTYWEDLAWTASTENGTLENMQAGLIAISFVVSARLAMNVRGPDRTAANLLSFVCFIFFFREVDFRPLPVPPWVVEVTSGWIRDVIFAVLLILICIYLWIRRCHIPRMFFAGFRISMWPLYATFGLLVAAEISESIGGKTPYGRLAEESLEFFAFGMLLFICVKFWLAGAIVDYGVNPAELRQQERSGPASGAR